jgi:hypothetical protein
VVSSITQAGVAEIQVVFVVDGSALPAALGRLRNAPAV